MPLNFSQFLLILFLLMAGAVGARAQQSSLPDASTPSGRPRQQEELPKTIKENLFKRQLELEKKEFEEMIQRGEEAAKLSEELDHSFEKNKNLTGEDRKKLARLEKLIKKIRDDLGGEEDREEAEKETPKDVVNALKSVRENAVNLLEALKKTSRLTISAVAIESSNTVLKLIRFIRFNRN